MSFEILTEIQKDLIQICFLFCFFLLVILSKTNDTSFLKFTLVHVHVFMCIYVYMYGRSVLNVRLVSEYTLILAF